MRCRKINNLFMHHLMYPTFFIYISCEILTVWVHILDTDVRRFLFTYISANTTTIHQNTDCLSVAALLKAKTYTN